MTADMPSHLIPKLRFPEFHEVGEWEEKLVGDMFKVTRGKVLAMPLVQDSRSNETPFPVYSSQTKNRGLAGYYSKYLYEDAITWTTDGANAGDVNYRPGKFYCTNVCGVLINNDGQANLCTAELINRVSRQHVSFVGNPKLMNGVMAKIAVPFPALAEQRKIADCLGSLDDLIAAEGRKLEALRQHKQGLMQQIFPQPGETVPRLRFPEFRDASEWEEKKIGALSEVKASGDLDVAYFSNSQSATHLYPIYSNAVENAGLYGYYSLPQYKENSVTITARGTLGVAFLRDHEFMGIGRLIVISNFRNLDPCFLKECWNHLAVIPREVTSIPQLTAITVRATVLPIPRLAEQQHIAACLSSLEDVLAAQARKINALKQHKQGLLQQLFPNLETK